MHLFKEKVSLSALDRIGDRKPDLGHQFQEKYTSSPRKLSIRSFGAQVCQSKHTHTGYQCKDNFKIIRLTTFSELIPSFSGLHE